MYATKYVSYSFQCFAVVCFHFTEHWIVIDLEFILYMTASISKL